MSGAAIPAAARLVGRRLLAAVPVPAAVTFGVFALAAASPFDPVQQYAGAAGLSASQETLDQLRANLALDGPFPQRWWEWLTSAVQGDLGDSTSLRQPVAQAIGERLGWSVLLCAAGFCFAVTAGTALGVAAARRRGGLLDGNAIAAVGGVSFDLVAGECLALVGESGCGKSVPPRHCWGSSRPTRASAAARCCRGRARTPGRTWSPRARRPSPARSADAASAWCRRARPPT